MRFSSFLSIVLLSFLIVNLTPACSRSAIMSTEQTIISTPSTVPTIKPTITTYPTYTPKPIKSATPSTPLVPVESQSIPVPTSTGESAPINCFPSNTSGYNSCTDNSGSITVEIPETWSEINGSTWTYQGIDIGFAISAAPDLTEFQNSFNAEGIFFGASGTFARIVGHVELLDYYTTAYEGSCSFDDRIDYNDGIYRGKYDKYSHCGGEGGYDAYVLGAREITEPSSILILIEIQIKPTDATFVDHIFSSFFVIF